MAANTVGQPACNILCSHQFIQKDFSKSRPGQKAVHGRVPDVIVNAVADAIELAHVGGDGGVPADLQMHTAPVKLIKADIPNDSVPVSIQPQRAGTLAN